MKKQAFSYRFKKRAGKAFLLCSILDNLRAFTLFVDAFFTFSQVDAIMQYV